VPQLDRPRTTPRWERIIVPAVLAILGTESQRTVVVGGAVDILFDFREVAGPYLRKLVMVRGAIANFPIPLLSSHTASCLAAAVVSQVIVAPRKKFAFGQGTRSAIGAWHASYLKSSNELGTSQSHTNPSKMAARTSIVRAARQLTNAAAKRPSPFVCQRWQLQAQRQRLFSVSAACKFWKSDWDLNGKVGG
jgi:hypothetical protein